ncbi:enoyl-CoA hydratase/isomerase family protein, partial [Chloroflexota bacterium]
ITYNRPDGMNGITLEMMKLEEKYLEEFVDDNEAWALIYAGAGGAFCTGLDVSAIEEIVKLKEAPKTLLQGAEVNKPIIAAIQGYCVGGGLELAAACDIRIASDDARFGAPEVTLGLIPGAGGCQRLPRIMSLGNALLMLLTGRPIDAYEAYRIGLVQKLTTRDRLLEEAISQAEMICANGPVAVRIAKQAAYSAVDIPLSSWLEENERWKSELMRQGPNDMEEGPKAFGERRAPIFKGN